MVNTFVIDLNDLLLRVRLEHFHADVFLNRVLVRVVVMHHHHRQEVAIADWWLDLLQIVRSLLGVVLLRIVVGNHSSELLLGGHDFILILALSLVEGAVLVAHDGDFPLLVTPILSLVVVAEGGKTRNHCLLLVRWHT